MYKMTFSFSVTDHKNHEDRETYNWERTLTPEQEAAELEAREILESFSDDELIALLEEDGIIIEKEESLRRETTFSFTLPQCGEEYNTKMPMNLADPNANSYPLAS